MSSSLVMRNLLRKRPLLSFSLASGVSATTWAVAVEYQATRRRRSDHRLELPQVYDWNKLHSYFAVRPVTTTCRLGEILWQLGPVVGAYFSQHLFQEEEQDHAKRQASQQEWAASLREALTNLGPAFVKAGQQLSIRPDLVSPAVLKELQKLCDSVRPIPEEQAMQVLREELQTDDLSAIFEDMELVAAASLGQVYKARLVGNNGGKQVAIKVQRPNMRETFALDLYIVQRIGVLVDLFTSTFTQQPPFHKALYESFAAGSYQELDYLQEAANQMLFQKAFRARKCPVLVPDVYEEWTTRRVLTTSWIDATKLADCPPEVIRRLIPIGVELFLTQLLDMGVFHADGHPGNLLVTETGQLCLIDFGLVTSVDANAREALTTAILHLLLRDYDALVEYDAVALGFLPASQDTTELKPLLTKILSAALVESGSNLRKRTAKLTELSQELNQVFFQYPFCVPPFFALVTRGLGLLEGLALAGDPDFDIFAAAAPYCRKRAGTLLLQSHLTKSTTTLSWWKKVVGWKPRQSESL